MTYLTEEQIRAIVRDEIQSIAARDDLIRRQQSLESGVRSYMSEEFRSRPDATPEERDTREREIREEGRRALGL